MASMGGVDVSAMTEEEQIAMAMSMSQNETGQGSGGGGGDDEGDVPEEPGEGDAGAVKLQIRMPNGKRVVRRFLQSEKVAVVYRFVKAENGGGAGKVELKVGFPPKSIEDSKDMLIRDAGLAGEAIQARLL